jgi:hypothetical protein
MATQNYSCRSKRMDIKTKIRTLSYFLAFSLFLGPLIGCGVFDQYKKNADGYYERHYTCCGPIALEKAFQKLYRKHGIMLKRAITREEISRSMQDDGIAAKELLSYFNKEAICITWPSEMKATAKKYGFEPITIKDFKKLDPKNDVALVLVHSKLTNYHWLVFPIDDPKSFYGTETKIDKIYLLKKL